MPEDRLNILLIEDTDTDAEIARRALKKAMDVPYDIQRATSMAEAEAILRTVSNIHLVLLDLGLPDTNGRIDTVRRLEKAKKYDIPTLVLTSVNDRNLATDLVGNGAVDYMKKTRLSWEPESLHETIGFTLRRHKNMNSMKQEQQQAMAEKDKLINYMTGSYSV